MTEMPFPISSNVATTVKIQDSAGNDITATVGKVGISLMGVTALFHDSVNDGIKTVDQRLNFTAGSLNTNLNKINAQVISHLVGKQNIRNFLEHGEKKDFDGQITGTTTVYTVPANKRLFIFAIISRCSTTGNWTLKRGGGLQDYLYNIVDTAFSYNTVMYVFNAGDLISFQENTGTATLIYQVQAIEVDTA